MTLLRTIQSVWHFLIAERAGYRRPSVMTTEDVQLRHTTEAQLRSLDGELDWRETLEARAEMLHRVTEALGGSRALEAPKRR